MDVLIIGGNRFVGYYLAWDLLNDGQRVTLLNRGSRPDPFGARVERITCDRKTEGVVTALRGRRFDAVVDFAAYEAADVALLHRALPETRHVMISTGQVYLVREGCPKPSKESDFGGPVMAAPAAQPELDEWRYGVGKRAAEEATQQLFGGDRLRIPMVNGARDYLRRIEGYLWRFADGGPILVPDGGRHRVRHVYGRAVSRAIARMLREGTGRGEAFNLAQDETPEMIEVLEILRAAFGAKSAFVPIAGDALRAAGLEPVKVSPFSGSWMSFLDPSKAKRELGFEHPPLEDYLRRIVESFVEAPPADRPAEYLASRAKELTLAGG